MLVSNPEVTTVSVLPLVLSLFTLCLHNFYMINFDARIWEVIISELYSCKSVSYTSFFPSLTTPAMNTGCIFKALWFVRLFVFAFVFVTVFEFVKYIQHEEQPCSLIGSQVWLVSTLWWLSVKRDSPQWPGSKILRCKFQHHVQWYCCAKLQMHHLYQFLNSVAWTLVVVAI